jgi:N4-gp56 family major capsid protein
MSNITTSSQVGPGVSNYYDKLLLARAKPEVIHSQFAQMKPLPSRNSDTIKFRRYTNLSTATTVLTEATTPAGKSLSVTDLTARVNQYGDYVTISDKVTYIVEDAVLNEATSLLGQQMGETMDEIVRDVLASTASVTACTHGVNAGTPTELTYDDIQGVVRNLLSASAKMFTPTIQGANKFGTAPVRKAFWAMGHTDLILDLENIDEFIPVSSYPSQDGIANSEWGSVGNVRFVLSPLGYESAGTYSTFVVGQEAYGITQLNEGMASSIYKPLGHGDDPLDQRATVGWKSFMASRILNDNWLINLQSTLGA